MSKGPAFLFTVFNRLTKSEIRPLTSPTARIFKDLLLPPSALPLIFLDFKPYLFLTLRELQISPDVKPDQPDQPDVLERFFQIFQSSPSQIVICFYFCPAGGETNYRNVTQILKREAFATFHSQTSGKTKNTEFLRF